MNNTNYEDILKHANNENKMVILYFTASWCNPCKSFLPIVMEVLNKLNNENDQLFKFFSLDIDGDDMDKLISKFNIKSVPTLILLNNLDILDRFTGKNKDKLINMLKIGKNKVEEKTVKYKDKI